MITFVSLEDHQPCSFTPPGNPFDKKHRNGVLVFSRKNSPKRTLQVRMHFQSASGLHSEVVNVWLSGEEAKTLADALA
jgi:hypothetical protein